MRRFDKKQNIQKVNLMAEQRHLESKGLISEGSQMGLPIQMEGSDLSPQEQEVYDDIISEMDTLNEGSFSSVLDKVKGYVSKGMLTAGILAALLATPGITNAQSDAIKDIANVEQTDTIDATSSVVIQVIGKSKSQSVSKKKANSSANKLAHMLHGKATSYEKVGEKVYTLDGDTITKLRIEIKLTGKQVQSLEKVISQYDSTGWSIVSK